MRTTETSIKPRLVDSSRTDVLAIDFDAARRILVAYRRHNGPGLLPRNAIRYAGHDVLQGVRARI